MKARLAVSALAVLGVSLSACSSSAAGPGSRPALTILVNVPVTKLPFVADFSRQGAELAAAKINKAGGVKVGDTTYDFKIKTVDNGLSPTTSLDNIKKAVTDKVIAIIDDGYTVDATYEEAKDAGIPIMVDYNGDAELIDPDERTNVFRIAPADDAMTEQLVKYVAQKNLKWAIIHDDSTFGKNGAELLAKDLTEKNQAAKVNIEVPSTATSLSDKALQVKQAGATGVLVWAQAPVLAQTIKALREGGVTAPIFTGPPGEDPLVRRALADHPDYIEGSLTFASFRITTEGGPEAWNKFRGEYEDAKVNSGDRDYLTGFKNSKNREIVQPPDWQVFPYDMVYLVKAALEKAGTIDNSKGKLIDELNDVQITSANGDNRGWKKDSHEAVVDDDIYFAVIDDMEFKPVQDDPLSKSLPPIDQI